MNVIKFYSLASSSSGNALLIESKNTHILIDCGISCRRICTALCALDIKPNDIDAILVTHEHNDHISGITVFSKKYHTPVYSGEKTLKLINAPLSELVSVHSGVSFKIGDIDVTPFDIPHDAVQPLGYTFTYNNKKIAVATDMGKIVTDIAYILKGSDFVFIESNHDKEMLLNGGYPYVLKQRICGAEGHLSNEQCAKLVTALAREGTKKFMLGHLSMQNNTPECAYKTNISALKENGFSGDIELKVANAATLSETVVI